MRKMGMTFIVLALVSFFAFLSSGCALLLIGGGAAGGYSISKDEIEILTDAKYNKIWKASTNVLRERGLVILEDKTHGVIEAEVEKSTITVHVDQATDKTIRLRVKGRRVKNMFPDMKKAQSVFKQIVKKIG